MMIEKIQLASH